MSELLIGYPDIPIRSSSVTSLLLGEQTANPYANLSTGARAKRWIANTSGTLANFRYDIGSGSTAAVEYMFAAGANILKEQGADRIYIRSWDGISNVNVVGRTSALSSATFSGPRGEDLLCASGFNDQVSASLPSSAFRYWELVTGHGSTSKKWSFRKLFFGRFLDLGRDPVFPVSVGRAYVDSRERAAPFELTLRWRGISDAKKAEFLDKVARNADVHPVVLWDKGNEVFPGFRTLHAVLSAFSIAPRRPNSNEIDATFREVV
jgi:hypothetical protein